MTKNLAIIGASGFIGAHMTKFFKDNNDFEVIVPSPAELDITKYQDWETFLTKQMPDFLILLAGSKDVKKLEQDADFAYKINTQPTKDIIDIIEKNDLKTKMIFFSSDYVFDGKKGDYKTDDKTEPKTNYGRSKLDAEKALLKSNIDFKIIRTSAVMGEGGVFYEWLKGELLRGNKIDLYGNVYFTPTPIQLLNESILKIVDNFEKINEKIIHIVGDKKLSRYEFGLLIKKELKSKSDIIKTEADISHTTFCNDLSMVQSLCIDNRRRKVFG